MFDLRRVPIGIDDFALIRQKKLLYVDKTFFIKDLIDHEGVQVFLFPRPRRFGKTMAMTMLRCFFEKCDAQRQAWFEGLCIWNAGPAYQAHHQKYPVVYLSLKDVKAQNADDFWAAIKKCLADLFGQHRSLLLANVLSDEERRRFQAVLDGTGESALFRDALLDLCGYLYRAHGEKVVLLIDEYDTPMHEAYLHGFAEPIVYFFRGFLGAALKGNPYLFKAVLTGILRISKESIFSDLNNLSVFSLLHPAYSNVFGFTEEEAADLLARTGLSAHSNTVRDWYNGYIFGGRVIYNPWSLLNFLANGGVPNAYWVNTSQNTLIKDMLIRHAERLGPQLETLLSGGEIERVLVENTALGDLTTDSDAFFSLLTFGGYLRAQLANAEWPPRYKLSIPNREVKEVYRGTFDKWLSASLERQGGDLEILLPALLKGDAKRVEKQLQRLAAATFSYHDISSPEPEKFYHGFVLGLLAALEPHYRVRSNRESGDGRPDVLVLPADKGKPGVVLELKAADPGEHSLDQMLDEGEAQLRGKNYVSELLAAGVSAVVALVLAFDGKTVRVRKVSFDAA